MVRVDDSHGSTLCPKRIAIKFSEVAIIPDTLVERNAREQPYILHSGETVLFDYRMTCDNINGFHNETLDEECKRVYGIPFQKVELEWYRRLGNKSRWWHRVKMIKL